MKIPNIIIYLIIGSNLLSRLWIVYERMPKHIEVEFFIYPLISVLGLLILWRYWKNQISRTIIISLLVFSIFIVSPQVVDANRALWVPWWHDVVMTIYTLPPSKIFLIDEYDSAKLLPRSYVISGNEFQHEIQKGSYEKLIEILKNKKNNSIEIPEYVVLLCHRHYEDCNKDSKKLTNELNNYNLIQKAISKRGVLLELTK